MYLELINKLTENGCHAWLCSVCSSFHFGVCHFGSLLTDVCNHADAETTDAAMVGDDHFGNGAHTYGVGAEKAKHARFCRRFIRRALCGEINALSEQDMIVLGNAKGFLHQLLTVSVTHVGETRTGSNVLSSQRIVGHHVDVVRDEHEVADMERRICTSCGIADKKSFNAEGKEYADGESN